MRCQHYIPLLLMCTSFKKEFNVEEERNHQMNIIIIFLVEDPLDIELGLEHTCHSVYFREIHNFSLTGRPQLIN